MSGLKLFNILLVEDDDIDVMNIQRSFKKGNIMNPVYVARDGLEGLDLLLKGLDPVVVLLDINMPRMNGLELLRAVRTNPDLKHTIVVMLTTSDHDRDRFESYQLGVSGYIVKPVDPENFMKVTTTIGQYWGLCELP